MKLVLISNSGEEYVVSEDDYTNISNDDIFEKAGLSILLIRTLDELKKREYNSNLGDNIKCKCTHPYYRHFDTYDNMRPVGCKYCPCDKFKKEKS